MCPGGLAAIDAPLGARAGSGGASQPRIHRRSRELPGGGRSPPKTVCGRQIPVDKERNREFSVFASSSHCWRAEIATHFARVAQNFALRENREFLISEARTCED
jgi:hypothetical protein